jgi:succinate dehydrogenase / fumarate reductase cytochrome b subunit
MASTTVTRRPAPKAASPGTPSRKVPFPIELYRSAVGKKYVMAVTGIILMGFVFGHMIGNLKMYLGYEDMNHYAEFLRELFVPLLPRTLFLWLIRVVLIASFVLHMHSAYSLTRMNSRSRDTKYQSKRDYIAANFASRTMRWSGVILILFIAWHLADLTWGFEPIAPGDWSRGDAYGNTAQSLERIPVALLYVVANLALGVHLFHGAWSLFQSLGWNNPRFNRWRRNFATAFAAIIVLGNVSFPIAVLAGVVSLPGAN